MKITTKTTKEQVKTFLKDNINVVSDSNLKDRVNYAIKVLEEDETKVTKKDLADLVKEVVRAKDSATVKKVEPKAENSLKKPVKKEAPKTKEVEAEAPVEEEAPKKKVSKKKTKTEGVKAVSASSNSIEYAVMFPKNLEAEIGGKVRKFELAPDLVTMEDLNKAYYNEGNEGEENPTILFAFYWTKRCLRQFSYFGRILGQPESFENDLDLAIPMHISDEFKVAHLISLYTEAPYAIIPEDLVEEEGIRISAGTEFQIYREVIED